MSYAPSATSWGLAWILLGNHSDIYLLTGSHKKAISLPFKLSKFKRPYNKNQFISEFGAAYLSYN